MAITSDLIGRIGGGGTVDTIDVNFANPSSNGTYDVVTVPVPSGVPHLVALEMETMDAVGNLVGSIPQIFFNAIDKGCYSNAVSSGDMAGVFDAPVTIRARRNSSSTSNSAAFTGTVYYCPLGS